MRRGVRDAVRHLLQGGGDALHHLSRPTLRTLLCAGAFAPVVATAEGSGATTVAGIAVLGGVGTNILSEIISSAIDKKRQRREGHTTERQCQDELKSEIAEKLETGDAESNRLEEEINVVLRQVGVGRELIWAALDAPGEYSMNLFLEQLTRLALELERFGFIFDGMAAVAGELAEQLEGNPDQSGWGDQAAELYWKRSKVIELLSLRRSDETDGSSGPLLGAWMVPGIAGNSIPRPALLRGLTELLYQDDNPVVRVVSIEGTAGFGKTTVAIQACHDDGMKVRYPGGILWVTIGRDAGDASIAESISRLHEVITGNRLASADASVAAAQLGSQLDQIGPSLLVIDDVWSASQLAPFLIGGSRCTRLITTRNVGVAPPGSPTVIVDQMSDDESLQLLVRGTAALPSALASQLLGASGRWPILLNLINGVLVELTNSGATPAEAASWALTKLGEAGPTAFDWDVNDQSSRDRAVRLTIETSLSLLPASERLRYLQLSATPRGKQIPIKVLYLLWADQGYDEARTALVRATFIRLRLAAGCWIDGEPGLYLHDILHDYARHSLPTEEITTTHMNFVANARNLINFAAEFESSSTRTGRASPWWALLDDPLYLWECVPWHLAQANLTEELRDLLVDLRWVASKIRRTGSAAAVEIDLRLCTAQEVSLLLKVVQQSAHLLRADDGYPTISATLLSRVEHAKGLESSRDFFRRTLNWARVEAHMKLPDAPSEAVRYVFADNSARVNSVSISPDGLLVVSGADDGTIRIWNVSDRDREVTLIHEDKARIRNVALSPDCTVLASCSDNASAAIWSLLGDRPALMARITGINATAGVFSSDGRQLALGGKDGSLALYDTTGELLRRARGDGEPTTCISYSQDGDYVATGSLNHVVRIYDLRSGRLAEEVIGRHEGPVGGICFGANSDTLYSAGWDKVIRVSSVGARTMVRHIGPFPDGLSGVSVNSEANYILASCWNGCVYRVDATGNFAAEELTGHRGSVTCVAGSQDTDLIVSGGADSTVRIWRASGVVDRPVETAVKGVVDARFNGDGSLVALADDDGGVSIVNTAARNITTLVSSKFHIRPNSVDVSRDGFFVARAHASYTEVFDILLGDPEEVFSFMRGAGSYGTCIAFSPDGNFLGEASSDGDITLHGLRGSGGRRAVGKHDGRAYCVRFSEDGKLVISGGADGLIRLWNADGRGGGRTLSGHRASVRVAKLSPDGRWVVSVSDDSTTRIWSAEDAVAQGHYRFGGGQDYQRGVFTRFFARCHG